MHADFNLNKDLAAAQCRFFERLLILLAFLFLAVWATSAGAQTQSKPDILEIVELTGILNDFGAQGVAKQVEAINDTPKIKAVLLVVDSPGGGVLPSAVIYEELSKLKVPVVAWCNNICASGGVYVLMASSVKYIGVRTQTIGGSVGVIMQIARFNRLLDFLKIDNETYVSGSLKDAGNPTRAGREDEKKYLQGINATLASRFYELVQSRPAARRNIEDIKTARIYIGQQIVDAGLADAVMDRSAVVAKAKELSGSKSIYTRDELKRMSTAADERPGSHYNMPSLPTHGFGDVPWLIETLKEIRAGSTVRFDYLLPYRF